jgi:hypothetical protein
VEVERDGDGAAAGVVERQLRLPAAGVCARAGSGVAALAASGRATVMAVARIRLSFMGFSFSCGGFVVGAAVLIPATDTR